MSNDNPTQPDLFAKKIQQHHEAIQAEFDAISAGEIDSMSDMARKQLASKLLIFVGVIGDLAQTGETDAVRLSAAKYGIQFVLGKDTSDPAAVSPVQRLIDQLTKTPIDE